MTSKKIFQIIVDLLMTVMLLVLMAYSLVGEAAHELVGISMFILFIIHHILNYRWHQNLLKGRYSGIRILGTVINVLIFVIMICLMVSGIMISRHVFLFLHISDGTSFARTIHLLAAYWGFALMSVHLGLHWSILMVVVKKITGIKEPSQMRTIFLHIVTALIAVYGLYAFLQRKNGSYMLLKNQFMFFDFDEPLSLFFTDQLAIMGLFVCVGYYASKLLQFIKNVIERNNKIK
ncbi:DUF4405 domain-containing protein [Clostridium sp. JS66]|uniref:DUF4405 domain-containing protein n=1 Tax=Clostridium sp. JS66 TaxID=3064705 RepID=UPI00298E2035|nr:DUF4405 domain-containing protein [Clostridium sp. JS66]WPC43759.1 DUF4405 domain-containing protein [Clostridium sp. JS66]